MTSCLAHGGCHLAADAAEHDLKDNVLNFDGPLKAGEARASACARVQFGAGEWAGWMRTGRRREEGLCTTWMHQVHARKLSA